MRKNSSLFLFIVLFSTFSHAVFAQNCKYTYYNDTTGLWSNDISGIAMNEQGIVVVQHYDGLSIFKNSMWLKKQISGQFSYNALAINNNGEIFLGTYGLGLAKLKDTIWTYYDTNSGLPAMFVEHIIAGHNNDIWIPFMGIGLVKFDGTNFTLYDSNDVSNLSLSKGAKGLNGKMYFSSYSGEIFEFDGSNFTTLPIIDSFTEVSSIIVDNNGILWAMTYNFTTEEGALYKYVNNTWEKLALPFLQTNPSSVVFDKNGFMWLSTYEGLYKYTGSEYKLYPFQGADRILIDNSGNIWISAYMYGIIVLTESGELSGQIMAGPNPCDNGYVKLYKIDSRTSKIEMADSVGVDASGNYIFTNVAIGSYIVYAEPDTAFFPDYIGTYNKSADLWQSADIVKILFCDSVIRNVNVSLIYLEPIPQGPGIITGIIKSLDGTRATAEPIKDVDVTLRKVPGGVIAKSTTDENGEFKFTNLPIGTYGIFVDIPGLDLDSIRQVTITEQDTVFEGQDYGVDSNGIDVNDFSSIEKIVNLKQLRISPNPTYGQLTVVIPDLKGAVLEISLLNMQGQILYSGQFKNENSTNQFTLNLDEYSKGVYLLRVKSNKATRFEKILLQ